MPTEPTHPSRALSVLVADDDFLVRRHTVVLLQQRGHSGVAVENGQQAIDCLATRSFDLVLLDIVMPVLDGLATLARLRRLEEQRTHGTHQRIVMVTGHSEPGDRERLLKAGADGCIGKPFDAVTFRTELKRVMAM